MTLNDSGYFFFRSVPYQFHFRIWKDILRHSTLPFTELAFQIRLRSDYKERTCKMNPIKFFKRVIRSVKYIISIWLIINCGHFCWIMPGCCSYCIKGWKLCFYVIKDMSLNSTFFLRNFAQGNVAKHKGIVVESNAYFLPGISKMWVDRFSHASFII